MIELLQQIPLDRALLILFLAGQLWEKFKNTRASLRLQGERVGVLEEKVAKLETALEASRGRA